MVSSFPKDQEDKSHHVLRCIKEHLSKHFDCFRRIQRSLRDGDTLRAEPLTGGLTNYSYKIYLENCPDEILFAKLSFPYALWNPDRSAHYDVQRTRNEFEMMKVFAELAPNSAPFPYLCEPMEDMMVLVTEWCENDEQLASQVSKGHLDPRICAGLARSIASLHCADFDPDFNTGIRKTMVSTFDTMQQKLESMHNSTDSSRATAMVQQMGLKECHEIVDTSRWHYLNSRDCLVHSDLHVKNILVEKTTANGTFSLVDWEMAFAGPVGRDLGSFFPFLLSCALAHALRGTHKCSSNLMKSIDIIWDAYSEGLRLGGKSQAFIDYAFRSTLGWCGRFMFLGYFTAGSHVEDMPIDSASDKKILMDSFGVLGLTFMRWGFGVGCAEINPAELRRMFKAAVLTEIALLVQKGQKEEITAHSSTKCLAPERKLRRGSIGSLRNLLSRTGSIARLAQ